MKTTALNSLDSHHACCFADMGYRVVDRFTKRSRLLDKAVVGCTFSDQSALVGRGGTAHIRAENTHSVLALGYCNETNFCWYASRFLDNRTVENMSL